MITSIDRKTIWQNRTANHDKNSEKARNTGENPPFDKEHLKKNLQSMSEQNLH